MDDLKQKTQEIFNQLLGYDPDITYDESEDEINVSLEVSPQDSGLLIGYHGEVLTSIQLILNLIYFNLEKEKKPVRLNINNYKEKRQQSLEQLAQTTATKALERNLPIPIFHLSSYERRLVHIALADREDVHTYSDGESSGRTIYISPAKASNDSQE